MVSPTRFEFATATAILFGAGTRHEVARLAREWSHSVFVVTGREARRAAPVVDALRAAGAECATWRLSGEPGVDEALAAAGAARAAGAGVVIGIGGGSVIDLAKAAAALLTNPGDPLDYLEVVGRAQPLSRPPAPCIAVPTTAGTGSEVTRNAVLRDARQGVKVSMRSPLMLPRLAVVDPEFTLDLPPALTASTGMDALTQVIEPYLSVRANPLTDGFCVEGIVRAARSLRRAVADGADIAARTDMALASLMGGLALANAGLGAVHGLAAPIGGRFGAPHGAVCAALLPAVMRVNLDVVRRREAGSPAIARFATVARWLTGDPDASAESGIHWLEALGHELGIPGLAHYGITPAEAPWLVEAASRASSMRGNCVALDAQDLHEMLARAL